MLKLRNKQVALGDYHPLSLFCYYMTLLVVTMLTTNPLILGISLFGGFLYLVIISLESWRTLLYYSVVFVLITLTNPIFVHNGATVLFFLNDKPVTLEAVFYGGTIGLMLIGMMVWFKSYNEVMSSDKFIYLFGKVIPKLSLIISMGLRFIPVFRQQIKRINSAQKTLGLYSSDSYLDKLLSSFRVMRSLIAWSLENAIDTADSMKARGYGLKGRTSFSLFRFYTNDFFLLGCNLVLIVVCVICVKLNILNVSFYPTMDSLALTWQTTSVYSFILFLVLIPSLIEIKEQIQWRLLLSTI